MSAASAQAFLDRVESDTELAQRLQDAGGPDQAIGIIRDEGFDFTPEEMRDCLLDRYGDVLSTDQLDAIAAGRSDAAREIEGMGMLVAFAAVMAVAAL